MKSLEYIKQRIASGETGLTDIDYDDLSESSFKDIFKQMYEQDFPEDNKIETRMGNGTILSEVIYDPDADFNYFSMERSIHDGTLMFIGDTISSLLKKIFMCGTYNKEVLTEVPDSNEYFNTHHFKYTVGDIVVGTEYDGDFVPEEKKWMRERTTAMIPIKFEVVEN